MLKYSVLKFDNERGFSESFWNLCIVCGNASVRTSVWEDGVIEYGECLICSRMSEIMQLEESFLVE